MFTIQKSNKKASARHQIDIKGVEDGVLMLSGKQYRMVLEASSLNFELKSEDEQDALIETYESFLNSLPCPLQIIVRVREVDMDKYLDDLQEKLSDEAEEIYRSQLTNYVEFVEGLVSSNRILARSFYVVIPYTAHEKLDFELIKEQLNITSDIVAKGLARMGMQSRQLSSLEVLDLFYSFYNPEQAKLQPITNHAFQLLNSSYVRKETTV